MGANGVICKWAEFWMSFVSSLRDVGLLERAVCIILQAINPGKHGKHKREGIVCNIICICHKYQDKIPVSFWMSIEHTQCHYRATTSLHIMLTGLIHNLMPCMDLTVCPKEIKTWLFWLGSMTSLTHSLTAFICHWCLSRIHILPVYPE